MKKLALIAAALVWLIWDARQAGTYTASTRYVGKRRYGSDFAVSVDRRKRAYWSELRNL